ncbi:hypothetical protein LBMAG42_27670 [Deltaproteobacteria bacterium]|nr:hypothetical protein LBMAG42_27670 [Deltaproteobacteria bacterium]
MPAVWNGLLEQGYRGRANGVARRRGDAFRRRSACPRVGACHTFPFQRCGNSPAHGRERWSALRVTVPMRDRQPPVVTALKCESTGVNRAVMPRTEHNKISRLVSATMRAREEVMNVQPQQAATPRDFAAPTRAMQQLLPEHRSDHAAGVALGGARAHIDHFRIAGRLGHDGVGYRVDHPTWGGFRPAQPPGPPPNRYTPPMDSSPNAPFITLVAVAQGEHDAWYDRELASASEGFLGEPVDAGSLTMQRRDSIAARTGFPASAQKAGVPHQSCRSYWINSGDARIGTVAVWESPGAAGLRISSLYVDPDRRGRGVATRIIDQIQASAQAQGFQGVSLEAHWAWPRAVGLYLKLGFRVRHWKRSLTMFRTPNLEQLRCEFDGDVARLFVGHRLAANARREGAQLGWEEAPGSEPERDAWETLPTFALLLARAAFPLVRSREQWRAALGSDAGGPESLARRIVAWEAEARAKGWVLPTARIPGLTYHSMAAIREPPVITDLTPRLSALLEAAGLRGGPDVWTDAAGTPVLSVSSGGRAPDPNDAAPECIELWTTSATVTHFQRFGAAWSMAFQRERFGLACGVEVDVQALYDGLDLDPP